MLANCLLLLGHKWVHLVSCIFSFGLDLGISEMTDITLVKVSYSRWQERCNDDVVVVIVVTDTFVRLHSAFLL